MIQKARLTFFGTGTSQGVPIIGCRCPVCSSGDSKNKRFRSSALVDYCGVRILVDAGPDFRMQMLSHGISHLDAILLTHNHKDHTGGLDDVRALNYIDRKAVDVYCEPLVLETLKYEYGYAFAEHKYPGSPEWHIHIISEKPFGVPSGEGKGELVWVHDKGYFLLQKDGSLIESDASPKAEEPIEGKNVEEIIAMASEGFAPVIPIRGLHGQMPVLGFRFGNIAYITDMSKIPEEEFSKLHGLDHVTLNTVSYKPHHSHFSLDEALSLADRIGAKNTWLTHLSHTFPVHEEFEKELSGLCRERGIRSNVRPAYDGLVIE